MKIPSYISILLASFAVFAMSCGDETESVPKPEFASEEPGSVLPPSGQRYFPGGGGEYFGEDSPIVTIRPELGYRPDLKLHDDVYWLTDEVAKRRILVDESTVRVPVTGPGDVALRYKAGMVLINKYYPIRHRILNVERQDGHVIWTVRMAGYDEVIKEGEIYLKVPEGEPTPVGLDVLDPWLYESREEQLEDIRENYLDSELIQMMASEESIEAMKELESRGTLMTTRQRQQGLQFPRPAWCDSISEESLACSDLYETGSDEFNQCESLRLPCDEVYDDEAAREVCEEAKANGDFDTPELLLCDAYVRNNVDVLRVQGDPEAPPEDWDQSACIDNGTTVQCNRVFYERSKRCLPLSVGSGEDEDEDGEEEPYEVCPIYWPDASIDSAVDVLCEGMCGFEQENRSAGGGANADDWSSGVGVCINSDVFGDEKCRASIAIKIPFEIVLEGDVTIPGDPDDANSSDVTIPNPVTVTLQPVFTSAVGFEADMSIGPFWAGVKIGFFAGVGIGLKTTLEVKKKGVRWTNEVDLFDELDIEKPEVPLPPILFLTFFLRPDIEAELFVEASVEGSVSHNYFQEKSFALCVTGRIGGGIGFSSWPENGVHTGQAAVDKCGLAVNPEGDSINELVSDSDTALEIRAGVELPLGIELVLKIAGEVETGNVTYYPFIPRFSIGVTLRPPRCSLDIVIAFGWRLSAALEVGISRFTIELAKVDLEGTYEEPNYYETFPIDFFPGCGVVEPPDPAVYEGLTCPPGPDPDDPDGNCATLDDFAGGDARCFVDRCVAQEAARVSLAWYDPDTDLDLYVRDPNGVVYSKDDLEVQSCGATCGGTCSSETDCLDGWGCESGRCAPEDPTYIENFVSTIAEDGEWEAWVVPGESESTDEVLFDLEFESGRPEGPRRSTRGTLSPGGDNAPIVFVFCLGEGCE